MDAKEAQVVESLIRRIDAQGAKIKRAEWAINHLKEEAGTKQERTESEEEKRICEALLTAVDFIEKCMEG